jgi:5'-methylthioadenosine/S-adenosylhomocysteine nucleosidase
LFLASLPCSSLFADTAVFVALPSELDAVRQEVRLVGQPVELAGRRVSIGYRKGEKLYLVRTGAGNLNSAMVTEGLIAKHRVDRVISIGVAGNLNDEWKIGDVLIASDVMNHQQGKETPTGFETQQKAEGRMQNEEYRRECEELRKAAKEIATEILRQAQNDKNAKNLRALATLREGTLVAGDSFIAGSAKRKWLRETFNADAVDMVSAGIARVCEANGVPYVILRVLSDNADEDASADFAAFVQNYRQPVTAEVALRMIEQIVRDRKGADTTERVAPNPAR